MSRRSIAELVPGRHWVVKRKIYATEGFDSTHEEALFRWLVGGKREHNDAAGEAVDESAGDGGDKAAGEAAGEAADEGAGKAASDSANNGA